jgi:hypothetical protein
MKALYKSHNFYKKLKLKKTVKSSKFSLFYNESSQKQHKHTKLLSNHLKVRYKTSIYKNYINFLKMQTMITLLSQKEMSKVLGFNLNAKIYLNNFIKKIPSINYHKNKLLTYKFLCLELKKFNSK